MKKYLLFLLTLFLFQTMSAVDVIQFRSIDFQTNVVEIHNFGSTTQSLTGWRFCTHDENQTRQYSSPDGLNGVSIAAGESLFIYWDNDAPAEDANNINLISIGGGGGFATPLDLGPFGMQIYINSSFNDGSSIGDHWQWSSGGADNASANERSDEAVAGGVWVDVAEWIPTTPETARIELTDTSGARLHSPANYRVLDRVPVPSEFQITGFNYDLEGNVDLIWEDLSGFGVFNYTVQTSPDLLVWSGAGSSDINSLSLVDMTELPAFFRVVVE